MTASASTIYAACDAQARPLLEAKGFQKIQAGEFVCADSDGQDRVLFDADIRKGRFAVLMSYYPDDCSVIEELSGSPKEERGFPCGPYLSQIGVGRRQYWWPCRTSDALLAASVKMKEALQNHGLHWLQELRDPKRFASEVDPIAALYAGFAHERAGEIAAARERYEEMQRRLLAGMKLGISESEFIRTAGRQYIFVAKKLRTDSDRVQRFEQALGEVLEVVPL